MEIVRYELNVKALAARWAEQYPDPSHKGVRGILAGDIHAQLLALPASARREDVNAIIGNDSWTGLWCDGCSSRVSVAVELSERVTVCFQCVRRMRDLCVDVELELRKQ